MKIKQLATLLTGALMFGMVACEYVTVEPNPVVIPVTPVDFTTQIEPIFTQLNCIMCHTGTAQPNLTVGKAYASLISMNLVDTLNPGQSVLMQKINSGHNTATNMTAEQKALILKWITEGAKGVIPPVSFKNEIEPLFTGVNCTMCHSGAQIPDLRTGKAYASLTGNNLVKAKDPDNSILVQKINAGHNTATNLTAAQKALINKWITEGANNN